jgi:hypothetical protein
MYLYKIIYIYIYVDRIPDENEYSAQRATPSWIQSGN